MVEEMDLTEVKVEVPKQECLSEKEEERVAAATAMLEMSCQITAAEDGGCGLDVLVCGIEMLEEAEQAEWFMFDTLCEATRQDCYDLGMGDNCHKLGIQVLCQATLSDYIEFLNWVDPMVILKREFAHVRQYPSPEVEIKTQQVILEMVRFPTLKKIFAVCLTNDFSNFVLYL